MFAARPMPGAAVGGSAPMLQVTLAPAGPITGSGLAMSFTTVTITGSAANASGAVTWAWTIVSTVGCAAVALAPASNASAIRLTGVLSSDTAEVVARLTATDAGGNVAYADVQIIYQNIDYR